MQRKKILLILLSTVIVVAGISTGWYLVFSRTITEKLVVNLGTISTATSNVVIKDQYAYVADGRDGVYIVDVSSVEVPHIIGHYPTSLAEEIVIHDSFAFIADAFDGLVILDISQKITPILASTYQTGNGRGLALKNSLLYFADGENGLYIFNVSTPSNLTLVGTLDINTWADTISIDGNIVYMGTRNQGILIIDVSNPADPYLVGSYSNSGMTTGAWIRDIWIEESIAYVAVFNDGLLILNITDPFDPVLIESVEMKKANSVHKVGNFIFVADTSDGIYKIDIQDLAKPKKKMLWKSDTISDIFVIDETIFAHCQDGLKILQEV